MKENENFCCHHSYYDSITAALEGIRDNTAPVGRMKDARVEVIRVPEQCPTLRLLENVYEPAVINITQNLELDLNGKTLYLTEAGCLHFAEATDCTILGTNAGSMVHKLVNASTENPYLVQAAGVSLKLKGGDYKIAGCHPGNFLAIKATASCGLLEVTDCRIIGINGKDVTAAGVKAIQTQAAKTVVCNATLKTEAGLYAHSLFGMGEITVSDSSILASSRAENARAIHMAGGDLSVVCTDVHAYSGTNTAYGVRSDAGSAKLSRCRIDTSTGSGAARGVYTVGTAGCAVEETEIVALAEQAGFATGIHIEGGTVSATDVYIRAVNSGYAIGDAAYGIYIAPGGSLNASRSYVLADARGDDVEAGPYSMAIHNSGTATLEYVKLHGTHSGVNNAAGGKLYASGGQYSGYCHGGVYLAQGADGEAFLNNVHLHGGFYYGEFAFRDEPGREDIPKEDCYPKEGRNLSAIYMGSCSGGTAHMDGCTIDGSDAQTSLVLRGSDGEQNNTLNVSNTTLTDGTKKIRVDSDTLRLNVGSDCNITADSFANTNTDGTTVDYLQAGRVAFTDGLYRNYPANHVYNGWDYDDLVRQAGVMH